MVTCLGGYLSLDRKDAELPAEQDAMPSVANLRARSRGSECGKRGQTL
jgi:hypothetical protein